MLRHRNLATVPLRVKIYCTKMQDELADSLYTFDLRSSGLFRPVTNILSLTFKPFYCVEKGHISSKWLMNAIMLPPRLLRTWELCTVHTGILYP
jgi:hypothetical protein